MCGCGEKETMVDIKGLEEIGRGFYIMKVVWKLFWDKRE